MAEPKTRPTSQSVPEFLESVQDERVRRDCWTLVEIMKAATRAEPQLWGPNIVGFGSYRMKYADGRETDWMLVAFSPRKANITLYIMPDFAGYDELMAQLGKHSCGKSCLYIKRLADVHLPTLTKLVESSVAHMRARYPSAS
jgi:hypothetical protein